MAKQHNLQISTIYKFQQFRNDKFQIKKLQIFQKFREIEEFWDQFLEIGVIPETRVPTIWNAVENSIGTIKLPVLQLCAQRRKRLNANHIKQDRGWV